MKKKITVKGMTCKSCVKIIEENLSELKGVKKVKVDLVNETATIEYNDKKIHLNRIKQEIVDLGFKVKGYKPKKKGFLEALMYGLIPHIGCIAFVLASIFGATLLMQFFKPLLMNRYFFHALVGISFLFATLSAYFYLKKEGFLSLKGMKRRWKYLVTMYGTTIGVNLLLFLVIFPMLANVSIGKEDINIASDSMVMFSVNIPCSGHAPLISEELKTIDGVNQIEYSFPNNFEVSYDSTKTSEKEMLDLVVFDEYPATVVESEGTTTLSGEYQASCGISPTGCSAQKTEAKQGCSGSCGGSCGKPTCGCGA